MQGFSVARDPSIAVDDAGDVHIAYYDPIGNDLEYATNARGAWDCGLENGWHCVTIESVGDTGAYPSIFAGGQPSIAYYNRTTGQLRLAERVGLGGTGANCGTDYVGLEQGFTFVCEEIDTIGSQRSQVGISLALDNAEPVIAYSWGTEITRLKLAQRSQRIGAASGNCGELYPGDLFLHWQCDVINDNSPYSLGDEIDLAVNPSGVTYIAYLEDNYIDQEEHLKVANQYIPKFVYIPLVRR
jgi:hypothetical protein